MADRRAVRVHARVSPAELADWRAKAAAAGVPLSDLLRRAMARTRTWTAVAADAERERTRQVARIGNNLNQFARWANRHASAVEGVEVLRGDPDMVAAVTDSLEFEHKYRSIVIEWAPEDRPSDAQINAVVDEFEKTAWAGLEPDLYSWTAVLHREHGGGVHVHILTARCDLKTGKSLNIA